MKRKQEGINGGVYPYAFYVFITGIRSAVDRGREGWNTGDKSTGTLNPLNPDDQISVEENRFGVWHQA
jgi:hypothetical protein